MVLEAVLDVGRFDGIEVTRAGLREGVFFGNRLLSGSVPLLPDVRAAAVRNLALQCDADMSHADRVARLALQMHDSLTAGEAIAPAADERALLWAAGMLHDIGMAIGYDGHTGHSHYTERQSGGCARIRTLAIVVGGSARETLARMQADCAGPAA